MVHTYTLLHVGLPEQERIFVHLITCLGWRDGGTGGQVEGEEVMEKGKVGEGNFASS